MIEFLVEIEFVVRCETKIEIENEITIFRFFKRFDIRKYDNVCTVVDACGEG